MKNIELIDKAIDKFNGVWPKAEFDAVDTDKWQEAILLCLAPANDVGARIGEIHCGSTGCDSHYFEVICTESEFLARKAERQNKPDWNDHDYNFIQQGKNGQWYGSKSYSPPALPDYLTGDDWHYINIASSRHGEVIGDNRDTIEQRPAVTESDWPDEKRIDVVATNGNDGLHYAGKAPEFKFGAGVFNLVDDNDWHARGELPPMGTECEYTIGDNFGGFKPCHFVGINSRGSLVVEGADGILKQFHKHQINLRPLRTEREKFVETVTALARKKDVNSHEDLAGVIFDAGFRAPEVK